MRMRRLTLLPVLLAITATAASAMGPLRPEEAKRFVSGKLFSYSCFDGTRGLGRIYADGSVIGTIQIPGKEARFVAMPTGTIQVSSTSICTSLRGALFQPCFDVVQTSKVSFRGSVSGLGFAYCDFVEHNPRQNVSKRVTRTSVTPQNVPAAEPIAAAPAKPAPVQSAVMTTSED
jgi:hypothetical protein